jgi:hypothetical protein
LATLTVTKFLTGRFVALQRRDISAGAATTELRVEVVHLAILNEMTNGYPAGEVVEVRFPADLNLNQYPAAARFLDRLFGEGLAEKATAVVKASWEAGIEHDTSERSRERMSAVGELRRLIIEEHKHDLKFGQIEYIFDS